MKWKILILLLFIFTASYGQADSASVNRYFIMTSPLTLLDIYNGSLVNIATEVKINEQYSLYSEFGKYFPGINVWSQLHRNTGFMIKEQVKKYYSYNMDSGKGYISVELCYSEQSYYRTDTIDLSTTNITDTTPRYARTYFVSRSFPGVSFQVGEVGTIRKSRIIYDVYGGLGIRFNTIKTDLPDKEAESRDMGDWTVATNYIQNKGFHVIPKFYFGCRIGYLIK